MMAPSAIYTPDERSKGVRLNKRSEFANISINKLCG